MSNPDDPRTWITKAESDLLNIRNNLSGTPALPAASILRLCAAS